MKKILLSLLFCGISLFSFSQTYIDGLDGIKLNDIPGDTPMHTADFVNQLYMIVKENYSTVSNHLSRVYTKDQNNELIYDCAAWFGVDTNIFDKGSFMKFVTNRTDYIESSFNEKFKDLDEISRSVNGTQSDIVNLRQLIEDLKSQIEGNNSSGGNNNLSKDTGWLKYNLTDISAGNTGDAHVRRTGNIVYFTLENVNVTNDVVCKIVKGFSPANGKNAYYQTLTATYDTNPDNTLYQGKITKTDNYPQSITMSWITDDPWPVNYGPTSDQPITRIYSITASGSNRRGAINGIKNTISITNEQSLIDAKNDKLIARFNNYYGMQLAGWTEDPNSDIASYKLTDKITLNSTKTKNIYPVYLQKNIGNIKKLDEKSISTDANAKDKTQTETITIDGISSPVSITGNKAVISVKSDIRSENNHKSSVTLKTITINGKSVNPNKVIAQQAGCSSGSGIVNYTLTGNYDNVSSIKCTFEVFQEHGSKKCKSYYNIYDVTLIMW